MKRDGPTPDVYSYNALISACAGAQQFERALEQLDTMQAHGVAPDAHTFGLLIVACEKEARWAIALDLLQKMREFGLAPNVVCYTAAIGVLSAAARVDLAEQVGLFCLVHLDAACKHHL